MALYDKRGGATTPDETQQLSTNIAQPLQENVNQPLSGGSKEQETNVGITDPAPWGTGYGGHRSGAGLETPPDPVAGGLPGEESAVTPNPDWTLSPQPLPVGTAGANPADPNVQLGANLWGVETLFGRRGMNRVYGPAAQHAPTGTGGDGTPDTTYEPPKDPNDTGDGGGGSGGGDPLIDLGGQGGSGGGGTHTGGDQNNGDPDGGDPTGGDPDDPANWGPVGANSAANGAVGKDSNGFLRNEAGQFWVPGEGWSDYSGGSAEQFMAENPDAPPGSVQLGAGGKYWNDQGQMWHVTGWVDAPPEMVWRRDHPNAPAGTVGRNGDGISVNAEGQVWKPGYGWSTPGGDGDSSKENLTYTDANGNEKPIGDPETVGTEAWGLSQLDQPLLTAEEIFGDGGFGMMRPTDAKDHIDRGFNIMSDQIENMYKSGDISESTYNHLKKRMGQQKAAWTNEWKAAFGADSGYTPGFYADGTPWVPAGPGGGGQGAAAGGTQDPTNGDHLEEGGGGL
jgi:hypothetical protein